MNKAMREFTITESAEAHNLIDKCSDGYKDYNNKIKLTFGIENMKPIFIGEVLNINGVRLKVTKICNGELLGDIINEQSNTKD